MILVTGGTGLVGGHLLFYLVKQGEKVRATYRHAEKVETVKTNLFLNHEDLFDNIEWVKADILDLPSLTHAFKNINIVYHCAAFISFVPHDYKKLRCANIEATANVVNLCIENKIDKLCYVSSIAAIGKPLVKEIITEETQWNAEAENNVYAITKYGAEIEVWRATQEGVNAVIVNPGIILGHGKWDSPSLSIFKKVKKGISFYPAGGTGFVDVEDVVKAMVKLTESDIKNERFIVIAENLSYKEVLHKIAEELKVKPPEKRVKKWQLEFLWRLDRFMGLLPGYKRKLTRISARSLNTRDFYSNDKIKKELNFVFKPVDETIKKACGKM
ncbi:NAD-dependent epimerase/dehydratase family protein [Abyssalbus ytuae]|uniref:NAD-dependent epimerase/dehydratase family protein n=1 Tax=Abyssalbus ytuae TaxID=2926907 RepID=A0A9E7CSH7_9FLAO|nr:NAD-dependent epimerase/dehydratase family protein [Abyssalbus ytuae]UOB16301.1 NAD-dependent epimerase/dehydratase family protein [Abyssalbus ytuae]